MFNVAVYDINRNEFIYYDVMPYLIRCYKKEKDKPETFEEFKKFVKDEAMYQFWGRCEYEIILVDWPCSKKQKKIDVYDQICMNLDLVTKLLMDAVKNDK